MRAPRLVYMRAAYVLALALVLGAALGSTAEARETQLAGIRLGMHAINVLDIWGQPDGIVVRQAPPPSAGAGAEGMMGEMGEMGGMGGMGGLLGMPGSVPMYGGMGGEEGMGSMMGAGMGGPSEAGPGAMGAAGATGNVPPLGIPMWALPLWVDLGEFEVEWIYDKSDQGFVLGFVFDEDGYVTVISLAGEKCDFARTAMWRPHRTVKLGDSFQHVIYRYGYPDESITFDSQMSPASLWYTGNVQVTFTWGPNDVAVDNVFSRDCILRYTERNNVAFTFHEMKLTRINIWER
ncbi:MAG: hypothetical protein ACE5R4_01555 [Armatimonadota bacterium]